MNFVLALGRAIYAIFQPAPVDTRGLYERVTANPAAVPTAAQLLAHPATVGGLFMNAQNFAQLDAANVLATTNTLNAQLIATGWTWDPGAAGNTAFAGCQLLQGSIARGECAKVAQALRITLTAANPYGLVQAANNFTVSTYSGAYQNGFIAVHPTTLNLDPTLYSYATGNRVNYRYWIDHKTMTYGGDYYDACYNTSYANEPAMAYAQITKYISQNKVFTSGYVGEVYFTDDAAPVAAKGFYVQCYYNGNQIAPDMNTIVGGGYNPVYVGPIVIGNATANTDFGFDANTDYLANVQLH